MAEIGSAFLSILPSAKGFNSKLEKDVGGGLTGSAKKLGTGFGKAFALGAGVVAAAGIGKFLGDSLGEAREAQKVGALTANVIKSTGAAANVSAAQVGNLASAISLKTGIDDEAIQSGQNLLLTFTGVRNEVGKGNDIFNQATKTLVDMSAALGTDAKGSAIQLGKALNDPVKGVSALSRVGVSFTEQQKTQIKTLVESGKTVDAQKIILGELSKEFGGAAAATATFGDKAKVTFGNIEEQVGTALLPVVDGIAKGFVKAGPAISKGVAGVGPALSRVGGFVAPLVSKVRDELPGAFRSVVAFVQTSVIPTLQNVGTLVLPFVTQLTGVFTGQLLPALTSVGGFLTGTVGPAFASVTAFLAQHGTAVRAVAVAILAGVAAYKAYQLALFVVGAATRAYAAVQGILNAVLAANPIGIIIIALIALVAGLVYAYKNSEKFRAVVDGAFRGIKKAITSVINFVVPFVKSHWQLLLAIIGGPLGIIVGLVIRNFGTIKSAVSSAVNFVVNSAKKFGQFATAVGKHVSDAVQFFKEIPGKIKGFLTGLPGDLKTIGGNIIDGLKNGIAAAGQRVLDAVQSIIDKIPKFIRKRMGIASPSKVTTILGQYIGDGLAKGITSSQKKITKAIGKVLDAAKEKLSQRIDDFKSLASGVGDNLTGDLFGSFTTAGDFVANLTTVKGNLGSAIADFKTLKGFGLPPAFLAKLFADGGFPLIHSLASDQGAAASAASLFSDISSLSGQLGNTVAVNSDIGGGYTLADLNATLKEINKNLQKVPDGVGKSVNGAAAKGKKAAPRGQKGKK